MAGRIGIWSFVDTGSMAALREHAAEVESLGYASWWMPETFGRDPLVVAALLLDATTELVVGTGIASIYARDAVATSSAWRTFGEAFPERFVLGLGVSHAPAVEAMRGYTYARPIAAMREYLDAVDGALFTGPPPDVLPRRVLAALGPRMLGLAAERTDGAHSYFVPPEHTVVAREVLGSATLVVEQGVVLETDPIAAREIARRHARGYVGLPNYANNLRRLGFTDDELDEVDDRLVDAIVVWGDDDAIRARVQAHLDAGADEVVVQVLTGERGSLPVAQWRALAPALTGLGG